MLQLKAHSDEKWRNKYQVYILSYHNFWLNFMQKNINKCNNPDYFLTYLISNCVFKTLQNLLGHSLCPPTCMSQTLRPDFHTLLPSNDRVLCTWRLIFYVSMQATNIFFSVALKEKHVGHTYVEFIWGHTARQPFLVTETLVGVLKPQRLATWNGNKLNH